MERERVVWDSGGEPIGLTSREAERLRARGQGNEPPRPPSRSALSVILRNCLTRFNAINAALAALVLSAGALKARAEGGAGLELGNALFVGVALSASLIRIVQELRAKRMVERLRILARGKAVAIRDGVPVELDPSRLVSGDAIEIRRGDQIPADGIILESRGLEVDESVVTGEAAPVSKRAGDGALSGSYAVAGRALIRLTAVGSDARAAEIAGQATRAKDARSALTKSMRRLIDAMALILLPVGALVYASEALFGASPRYEAMLGAAAAMVGMVPQGLILLIEVSFAVGVIALGRQRLLVQTPPCIETLARVDVLCLDKTGTLTEGELEVSEILCLGSGGAEAVGGILAALVRATGDENPTARTIRSRFAEPVRWDVGEAIPFSSERRRSAVRFRREGAYALGAPDALRMGSDVSKAAAGIAGRGERALGLARFDSLEGIEGGESPIPVALIALSDRVKPSAAEAIRAFREQGVSVKILSGDHPATVRSIAERAGLTDIGEPLDMGEPPPAPIGRLASERSAFCRVTPEGKRELIASLRAAGHTVAMVGDGVNDAPALREADVGVAMANGSEAARAIADMVLLDSDFASMGAAVREGRRIANNMERVGSMYVNKTIFSSLLAAMFAFLPLPYPFIPFQMTFLGAITIGIPSFLLSFGSNDRPIEGDFFAKVVAAALPISVGVALSAAAASVYGAARGFGIAEIQTACAASAGALGLALVTRAARPRGAGKAALLATLCLALAAGIGFGGALGSWNLMRFAPLTPRTGALIAGTVAFGFAAMYVAAAVAKRVRRKAGRE